ncbi:MAG TPA: hypothetical protein VLE47_01020 [Candidatus Saccharimonadales bacterium]|nr:hypothetical protein [Candidatus Saccharimonadales bacterium]
MDIDVSKLSSQSNVKTDRLYVTVFLTNSLQDSGFRGFVKSITSSDSSGPFDVLPNHENFVTNFSKKLEIVPEAGERIVFQNKTGVMEVGNNVVRIFLEN